MLNCRLVFADDAEPTSSGPLASAADDPAPASSCRLRRSSSPQPEEELTFVE